MAVTDIQLANTIIYRLLENGNANAAYPALLTDMFDPTEIANTMDRVQQQFLLDTGMIVTRTTIAGAVGNNKYDLPTDSIRPRRVTWTDGSGVTSTLTQCDTWELDNAADNWPSDNASVPIAWWETTLPQQRLAIALTPSAVGTIGLLYIQLAATLTGAGVALTIPDDWSPYVLWGTLADLLGSDGPQFDPARASYCKRRYEEGVELARLVLGGP